MGLYLFPFILEGGQDGEQQQKELVVLQLGQSPKGQLRVAEDLAVYAVLHVKLVEQELDLHGALDALAAFVGAGLGEGNEAGQLRLGQLLVPHLVGGELPVQQGVQALLLLALRPVEGGLEKIAQEKGIGEGAALRPDVLHSQLGQLLPLPLGRHLPLPLEKGLPDGLHHAVGVGQGLVRLIQDGEGLEKVGIGKPAAPVGKQLVPDKHPVADGPLKILPGHKPLHQRPAPGGVLSPRRLHLRPQINVGGAQFHKPLPGGAHLRRLGQDDLPQAAVENLGPAHDGRVQVKDVPQHLIGVHGQGMVVEKGLQQAHGNDVALRFRPAGAFFLEICAAVPDQDLLQPLQVRLLPHSRPGQAAEGLVILISHGEHHVVAL